MLIPNVILSCLDTQEFVIKKSRGVLHQWVRHTPHLLPQVLKTRKYLVFKTDVYGRKKLQLEKVVHFDLCGHFSSPRARNQIFAPQENLKLSSRRLQINCPI